MTGIRQGKCFLTTGRRWLLAALFALGLVLLTNAVCNVSFLNNDDTNIMYALAGYRTGTPYPTHRFINVALGMAVSGLYRLLPGLPWWALYQVAALVVSITVVFACLLKLMCRRDIPAWKGLIGCILLYLTVYVYPVLTVSFTLTAGMLGTASAVLLTAYDPEEDGKGVGMALGSLALLMLCFFTRNSAGLSMLCFWGAAVFYQLLLACQEKRRQFRTLQVIDKPPQRKKCNDGRGRHVRPKPILWAFRRPGVQRTRGEMRLSHQNTGYFDGLKRLFRTLAYGAAGGVLALCCILLNNWGVERMNPAEYPAFEEARGRFTDYPHIVYGDDPAFFEDLGWDETVYDLADNLCFLDSRITADAMNAVMDAPLPEQTGTAAKLAGTLPALVTFFRGSGIAQYMVMIPALLALLALAFYCAGRREGRRGKGRGEAFLAACCIGAGAFVLCFYLCYAGRFPVRTFQLVALPASALLATLCVRLFVPLDPRKAGTLLTVAVAGAVLCWSLAKTGDVALRYDKSTVIAENSAAEAYCMAHPENVYLTDVTSLENLAAFTVYPAEKPTNLVDWGGTAMHSGWKERQLALNGVSDFTGTVFRRENVYFLTEAEGEKLDILYAYLAAHEGATGYACVDYVTETAAVYRFTFLEEAQ